MRQNVNDLVFLVSSFLSAVCVLINCKIAKLNGFIHLHVRSTGTRFDEIMCDREREREEKSKKFGIWDLVSL